MIQSTAYLVGIVMSSQTGTAIWQITLLVDMETMFTRCQATDVDANMDILTTGILYEAHIANSSWGSRHIGNGFHAGIFL